MIKVPEENTRNKTRDEEDQPNTLKVRANRDQEVVVVVVAKVETFQMMTLKFANLMLATKEKILDSRLGTRIMYPIQKKMSNNWMTSAKSFLKDLKLSNGSITCTSSRQY
jgi:hypothetical protein